MDHRRRRGILKNEPIRATPYWLVSYRLAIPNKPWVDFPLGVYVDPRGALLRERPLEGIPDCIRHPELCSFRIDERAAIEIARKAGLPEALGPFRKSVGLGKGRFQWTISAMVESKWRTIEWEQMLIDCGTGAITEHRRFNSMWTPGSTSPS